MRNKAPFLGSRSVWTSAADPGGVDPDPTPEKKTGSKSESRKNQIWSRPYKIHTIFFLFVLPVLEKIKLIYLRYYFHFNIGQYISKYRFQRSFGSGCLDRIRIRSICKIGSISKRELFKNRTGPKHNRIGVRLKKTGSGSATLGIAKTHSKPSIWLKITLPKWDLAKNGPGTRGTKNIKNSLLPRLCINRTSFLLENVKH